jgi:hypothetical protein
MVTDFFNGLWLTLLALGADNSDVSVSGELLEKILWVGFGRNFLAKINPGLK